AVVEGARASTRLGQCVDVDLRRRLAEAQKHAPARRFVEPGDAVEDRSLAGAVWADKGGDVATRRLERQVVDGNQPAEAHGEVLHAEQRDLPCRGRRHQPDPSRTMSARTGLASRRKIDGWRNEMSPRGRQIITSTMARPNSSMRYWAGSKEGPKIAFIQ